MLASSSSSPSHQPDTCNSSSSPVSTTSTAPSSVSNTASKPQQQVTGKGAMVNGTADYNHGNDDHSEDNSSDLEILETTTNLGKRKPQADTPTSETKKAKLNSSTSTPTPASASASTSASTSKGTTSSNLVELNKNKLVLSQRPLSWDLNVETSQGSIAFNQFLSSFLSSSSSTTDEKTPMTTLAEWPKEHWGFVAKLVHESDKTIFQLSKSIHETVLKLAESALLALDQEMDVDSESQGEKLGETLAACIPIAPLKALILSLAKRTNYGVEKKDLPEGFLPDGVNDVPAALQIHRWEVKDIALLPSDLETKLLKRRSDREEAKKVAVELVTAVKKGERDAFFGKKKDKKDDAAKEKKDEVVKKEKKKEEVKKEEKEKVKKVKILTKEEIAEADAKAEAKAEKEREKKRKEEERERRAAEKREKEAARDEKKAEKKAMEDKKKSQLNKQSNFMSGFLVKKSASPAPVVTATGATPSGSKLSDFDRVFHPFHIKPDVQVAPYNRFKKAKGPAPEVKINSDETITLEKSLAEFKKGVPKSRIPKYQPNPVPPRFAVREIVQKFSEAGMNGENPQVYLDLLQDREVFPIKMLKFHEDTRPGYVGSWSKTTRVVGPRTPFSKDTALLRYDYDSEEEWVDDDEEDAEEVDSSGERSDDEGSDGGLSDDWMCDDDDVVEYEDGFGPEDELKMDDDGDDDCFIVPTEAAEKLRKEKERKVKAKEKRKKPVGPLLPIVKGPYWEEEIGKPSFQPFESMRIQLLNDATFGLNPLKFISKPFSCSTTSNTKPVTSISTTGFLKAVSPAPQTFIPTITGGPSSVSTNGANTLTAKRGRKATPLPPSLYSYVMNFIDGNPKSRPNIVEDLSLDPKLKALKVPKSQLDHFFGQLGAKLIKGAGKGGEKAWVIPPDIKSKFMSTSNASSDLSSSNEDAIVID
ncbi:hypothetical protein T439DRAFT_159600 [Meredithblackwellia eburnea MCA 4105]